MEKPRYVIGDILYDSYAMVHILIEDIKNGSGYDKRHMYYSFRELETGNTDDWSVENTDTSAYFRKVA